MAFKLTTHPHVYPQFGVAPHVVSEVLGHKPEGSKVTQKYNRHRYDSEKRAALDAWAKCLRGIIEREAPSSFGAGPVEVSGAKAMQKP